MKKTLYVHAGVDIAAAKEAKKRISSLVKSTHGPSVLGGIGGFGGLFSIKNMPPDPVLVSSVDGVGTKLKLAFMLNRHDTVGQDLVNHCVDDILVQGARPLFFLDYLATGKLKPGVVEQVVGGIARACKELDCALLGGETAEMPGFYTKDEYDLAGTIVGVVSKAGLITGTNIGEGDIILGLASTGLHTNGYSLARKVLLEDGKMSLSETPAGFERTLGEELLLPHRCYAPSLLPMAEKGLIKGMVHITGGGFEGNIPRVVPSGLVAEIQKSSWPVPPVFSLIAQAGNVPEEEMYRTFNMGLGMLVVVAKQDSGETFKTLRQEGEIVYEIGAVRSRTGDDPPVILR